MKYGDFCLEVQTHFASLQRFFNEIDCPTDVDKDIFERSKANAIESCIELEHEMLEEFGEYFDD